jgi:hypothetical protein
LKKKSKVCKTTIEMNILPSNSKISYGAWNSTSNTRPYMPQQNGIVECFNKTIVKSARPMIHQRGVNTKFWVKATDTTVYLKSRSLHKVIDRMTLEDLHGIRRNLRFPILKFLGTHVMF